MPEIKKKEKKEKKKVCQKVGCHAPLGQQNTVSREENSVVTMVNASSWGTQYPRYKKSRTFNGCQFALKRLLRRALYTAFVQWQQNS